MHTVIYPERRSFERYDSEHYMLYLNEEKAEYMPSNSIVDNEEPESVEPVSGYSYTGSQQDGGTLIKAKEALYGDFVAGLIRLRYSADEVEAAQANMLTAIKEPSNKRAAEYEQAWEEFQEYRDKCKTDAKMVLEITSY